MSVGVTATIRVTFHEGGHPVRVLIAIDDTDDADSRGTGEIAEIIAGALSQRGLATVGRVTRHQLLIHPDIAYTSHNSSMCFEADVAEHDLDTVISEAARMLAAESVAAADPGLAVAVVDRISSPQRLIDFGLAAKERVLTKDEACARAEELGIHLSEHGGSGIGVIGALAGVGLKLTGNDGRFKGKLRLRADEDGVADVTSIRHQDVDEVRTMEGTTLPDHERILVGQDCKLIVRDGRAVLLVEPAPAGASAAWVVCDRKKLRAL
jgi:hypothetical protein